MDLLPAVLVTKVSLLGTREHCVSTVRLCIHGYIAWVYINQETDVMDIDLLLQVLYNYYFGLRCSKYFSNLVTNTSVTMVTK